MVNGNLKRKLVAMGWLALTLAATVLLVAAATSKSEKKCSGINVEIEGGNDHFFVDEKEVASILNANGNIKGRTLATLNLLKLEKRLENDRWIKNAELYLDNEQVLQVKIEENEPVARIFTKGGYSYYIDSSCKKLPLSDRLSARVPMVSNFPSDRARLGRMDSSFMAAIKDMAVYINEVPFWKAQVAQIYVNDDREIELIPTVGNQVILFGKPADVEQKFNRLYSFYKQVWANVGFEKYATLDVRFNNQVVAAKRGSGPEPLVDSVAAKKALNELMEKVKNRALETETLATSKTTNNVVRSNNIKSKSAETEAGVAGTSNQNIARQPKAVMPKKGED